MKRCPFYGGAGKKTLYLEGQPRGLQKLHMEARLDSRARGASDGGVGVASSRGSVFGAWKGHLDAVTLSSVHVSTEHTFSPT